MIVEATKNQYDYDREEVLMISDWFVENGDDIFKNIINGVYRETGKRGKGPAKPDYGDVPFESFIFNGKGRSPDQSQGELNTFVVEKGETIRFRIINSSSTYALKLQIDGHPMTVIESDGQSVEPVTVDGITVDIGERFDVLVDANGKGTHAIRAATLGGQSGLALLQYKGDAGTRPVEDAP